MKNQYRGGDCIKKGGGGLGQFPNLRGTWQERRGWCFFWGGVDTPMHAMSSLN